MQKSVHKKETVFPHCSFIEQPHTIFNKAEKKRYLETYESYLNFNLLLFDTQKKAKKMTDDLMEGYICTKCLKKMRATVIPKQTITIIKQRNSVVTKILNKVKKGLGTLKKAQ